MNQTLVQAAKEGFSASKISVESEQEFLDLIIMASWNDACDNISRVRQRATMSAVIAPQTIDLRNQIERLRQCFVIKLLTRHNVSSRTAEALSQELVK